MTDETEQSTEIRFVVKEDSEGQRLDVFVAQADCRPFPLSGQARH